MDFNAQKRTVIHLHLHKGHQDFTLMTTDVDSSKSKSLAVDSLLAAAAPNLSDSGRLA